MKNNIELIEIIPDNEIIKFIKSEQERLGRHLIEFEITWAETET